MIKIMNGVTKLEKAKVSSQRYVTIDQKNNHKVLILIPTMCLAFLAIKL
jgi:hypothetical protein